MAQDYVAHADVYIDAPAEKVWQALTDPELVKEYLFGTNLQTDWRVGSPIRFEGEYEGKRYEEKGKVVTFEEPSELSYTSLSSMSDKADEPSNYALITIRLTDEQGKTHAQLSQTNNDSMESCNHSETNWKQVLEGLKKTAEASD